MNSITQETLILCKETCAFAHHLFNGRRVDADLESVIEAGHGVRMLRFVDAICALVEGGHLEPACALTRTVLEAGWVLLAIRAEPRKFDDWLSHANAEGRKSIRRLKALALHERGEGLSDAEIDAAIATIPQGTTHPLRDWAAAAGTPQAYLTVYQTLSGYAHAELPAAAAYVRWSEEAEPLGIQDPDLGVHPADCLNICTALMHDVCRPKLGQSLTEQDQNALDTLEARRRDHTRCLEELRAAST